MSQDYNYSIYEKSDLDDLLELRKDVFGSWGENAREQFKWKYIENPFINYVPVFIAKDSGKVIGSRGLIAQELRINQEPVLGFQGTDGMVHPDHRKKGVYSSIYKKVLTHYKGGEKKIFFGFPGSAAVPGHKKHGCEYMTINKYKTYGSRTISLPDDLNSPDEYVRSLHSFINAPALKLFKFIEGLKIGKGTTVEKYESAPIALLTQLYKKAIPKTIHTVRSPNYYQWRLGEPLEEFNTYVLFDSRGEPKCGIIISQGDEVITIRDVLPLHHDRNTMYDLIHSVLSDNQDINRFVMVDSGKISKSFVKNGFIPSRYNPFVGEGEKFVTRNLSNGSEWEINKIDIREEQNWSLQLLERDH